MYLFVLVHVYNFQNEVSETKYSEFIGCETKLVFFQVALWGLKPNSNDSF